MEIDDSAVRLLRLERFFGDGDGQRVLSTLSIFKHMAKLSKVESLYKDVLPTTDKKKMKKKNLSIAFDVLQ